MGVKGRIRRDHQEHGCGRKAEGKRVGDKRGCSDQRRAVMWASRVAYGRLTEWVTERQRREASGTSMRGDETTGRRMRHLEPGGQPRASC